MGSALDLDALLASAPVTAPFRFVGHIDALVPRERIAVTLAYPRDNPNLLAHRVGMSVVPGSLLLEGVAQAAGLLLYATETIRTIALASVRRARFHYTVAPGSAPCARVSLRRLQWVRADHAGLGLCDAEIFGEHTAKPAATMVFVIRVELGDVA